MKKHQHKVPCLPCPACGDPDWAHGSRENIRRVQRGEKVGGVCYTCATPSWIQNGKRWIITPAEMQAYPTYEQVRRELAMPILAGMWG